MDDLWELIAQEGVSAIDIMQQFDHSIKELNDIIFFAADLLKEKVNEAYNKAYKPEKVKQIPEIVQYDINFLKRIKSILENEHYSMSAELLDNLINKLINIREK